METSYAIGNWEDGNGPRWPKIYACMIDLRNAYVQYFVFILMEAVGRNMVIGIDIDR